MKMENELDEPKQEPLYKTGEDVERHLQQATKARDELDREINALQNSTIYQNYLKDHKHIVEVLRKEIEAPLIARIEKIEKENSEFREALGLQQKKKTEEHKHSFVGKIKAKITGTE